MSFRRALAGFFIFIFVIMSLPTFLYFGLSNSLLRASFYEGPVVDQAYNFVLKVTAANLIKTDEVIADFFTETDLKTEMMTVFPAGLFKEMVKDFFSQVEKLAENPERPLTISMKSFRESLLTFANNLSYRLFQSLPMCRGGQMPEEDARGLPTCVPEGVEYNLVAAPFAKQFETSVYAAVPEQVQIDLNAAQGQSGVTFAGIFDWFMLTKYVLYGSLLALLVIIAILIYSPFSLIAKYEGIAFVLSGIAGYLLSLGLSLMPKYILADVNMPDFKEDVLQMTQYIVTYVVAESQKIALIFLSLGAVLILVRIFLVQKYNCEKSE